jgi:Tol biopolymer transport system component/DNA-binding winged helix-turn-helix (wHTH) protein
MLSSMQGISRLSFGLFEVDLQSGELWKAGRKIKLQSQPFKVLVTLLEHPGEVVTREDLQLRVWGKDTVVDFDHSLGTAINKIREALGDSADNPRFVETLARRGYRFIAPVKVLSERPAEMASPLPAEGMTSSGEEVAGILKVDGDAEERAAVGIEPASAGQASVSAPRREAKWWLLTGAVGLGLVIGAVGFYLGKSQSKGTPARIEQLTTSGRIAPGSPTMESFPASATDGLRIYTPVIVEGRTALSQVEIHTGAVQSLPVPSEIASPSLGDISPDGSKLLLRSHLSPESEQPLWIVPTGGGSALRIANTVAHDATWMPNGRDILYAAGNQLLVAHLQDGTSTPFAALKGRAFWMRWSPDGRLLRFTLTDPIDHTLGLWQINADGKQLRPILSGWAKPEMQCCGVWTGDGRYFVFQSSAGQSSDLWRLNGTSTESPVRVTNGPLSFEAPVVSRIGHRIFFLGLDAQSELQRYDPGRRQFVLQRDFLAMANRIDYSRDRNWVAWTDAQGRLWRARADGKETIQLTPDSLQVFLAHWSPDGSRLALMAREPGKAWQLYMIAADGGAATRLLRENRNAADPSWSADGQQIVFGRVTDLMGKEEGSRRLEILDLKTGTVTAVPGSEGLFSPRWSPNGRYIAALSLDQRRLMLFDRETKVWKAIAETSVADPVWSGDSRAIFFHASMAEMQPIYRVSIPEGRLEQIANLANFAAGDTADYFFCGITPDNVPIVRSRTATGNLYSVDLDAQ